jgi:hypothetical protein
MLVTMMLLCFFFEQCKIQVQDFQGEPRSPVLA